MEYKSSKKEDSTFLMESQPENDLFYMEQQIHYSQNHFSL